jgi:hypothetical protein
MPTYWLTDQTKVSDIIDFKVIKDIAKPYFSIKASLKLSSDHSLIIININNKIAKKMQSCVLYNKRINKSFPLTNEKKTKCTNVS